MIEQNPGRGELTGSLEKQGLFDLSQMASILRRYPEIRDWYGLSSEDLEYSREQAALDDQLVPEVLAIQEFVHSRYFDKGSPIDVKAIESKITRRMSCSLKGDNGAAEFLIFPINNNAPMSRLEVSRDKSEIEYFFPLNSDMYMGLKMNSDCTLTEKVYFISSQLGIGTKPIIAPINITSASGKDFSIRQSDNLIYPTSKENWRIQNQHNALTVVSKNKTLSAVYKSEIKGKTSDGQGNIEIIVKSNLSGNKTSVIHTVQDDGSTAYKFFELDSESYFSSADNPEGIFISREDGHGLVLDAIETENVAPHLHYYIDKTKFGPELFILSEKGLPCFPVIKCQGDVYKIDENRFNQFLPDYDYEIEEVLVGKDQRQKILRFYFKDRFVSAFVLGTNGLPIDIYQEI